MSPISEDELRARLRSVEPSAAQPGYAEHLIQQGRFRRRRQRWVTGVAAAAAVAVIGGGALVVSDRFGPDTALPATPTPTPTEPEVTPTVTSTASPSATATSTPSASPTRTPSATITTSGPTSSPSSTPSPSATPSRSFEVRRVTLLHETSGTPGSLWDVCQTSGQSIAAGNGVVEARVVDVTVSEGEDGSTEALLVFPNADRAVAYMGQLRQVVRACESDTSGGTRGVVENFPGPWGEGLALATAARLEQESGVVYFGMSAMLAVRSGSAVTLSGMGAHAVLEDRVPPNLIARGRPAIDHVAPQLCRYTQAGC